MVVVSELGHGLDVGGSASEALEDGTDVSAGLHGDDTELILLVNPDEESLGSVVEDTTAAGPVAVQATSLEEAVTLPE